MRHRLQGRKLGMTSSHRRSVFANLATALITHEQLRTTLPKAKELKRITDKLITLAKGGQLSQRRAALARLGDQKAVDKMWEILAPRYKERSGGYTRVLKMGVRYGDCSPMALVELVERDREAKGQEDKARHQAEQARKKAEEKDKAAPSREKDETKGQKDADIKRGSETPQETEDPPSAGKPPGTTKKSS